MPRKPKSRPSPTSPPPTEDAMAASEFLGLPVRVTLHSGLVVTGVVSEIQQAAQTMTLKDATLTAPSVPPQSLPAFVLPARDIADLQILPALPGPVAPALPPQLLIPAAQTRPAPSPTQSRGSPRLPLPPPPPAPAKERAKRGEPAKPKEKEKEKTPRPQDADNDEEEVDYNDLVAAPARGGQRKERERKEVPPQPQPQPAAGSSRRKRDREKEYMGQPSNWQDEEVRKYHLEEFDFQRSLALFDKPAIFAEIASEDKTPQSERLVAHNRLPEGQRKLGIREMVLTDDERAGGPAAVVPGSGTRAAPAPAAAAPNGIPPAAVQVPAAPPATDSPPAYFKSTATGKPVDTYSPEQWTSFLEVSRATGALPSVAENAGRGGATLCLPFLSQTRAKRRKEGGDAGGGPEVLVLAGDHETGAFALACARHLANFGAEVACFVARESRPFCEAVTSQLDHLPTPIPTASDLPTHPPLLLIDALAGPHHPSPTDPPTPNSIPSPCRNPTVSALRHAHQLLRLRTFPVLAFELPTGRDARTGEAWRIPEPLPARWVLAFGRPKEGLAGFVKGGGEAEVVLAYVGGRGNGEAEVFGERFACGIVPIEGRAKAG